MSRYSNQNDQRRRIKSRIDAFDPKAGVADLSHCGIINDEALFGWALTLLPRTGLKSLNLAGNLIGNLGALAIADAECLRGLEKLDLSDIGVDDDQVIEPLVRNLSELKELRLPDNRIGNRGVASIAEWLEDLELLDVSGCNVTPAGASAIAKYCENLLQLIISDNALGEAGAEVLATLTELNSLGIAGALINEAGAEHIARSLTNLVRLDISRNEKIVSLDLFEPRVFPKGALRELYIEGCTGLVLPDDGRPLPASILELDDPEAFSSRLRRQPREAAA